MAAAAEARSQVATSQMITKLIKVSIFLLCGLFELDKLAVGIVGCFFRHDGQAAPQGLDDAGHFVEVVVHGAALNGGVLGRGGVGGFGGLLDGEAVVVAQLLDAAAEVGEDLAGVLFLGFLFVVHAVFCLRGL